MGLDGLAFDHGELDEIVTAGSIIGIFAQSRIFTKWILAIALSLVIVDVNIPERSFGYDAADVFAIKYFDTLTGYKYVKITHYRAGLIEVEAIGLPGHELVCFGGRRLGLCV